MPAARPVAAAISDAVGYAAPAATDLKSEYKDVLGDLKRTFAIFIALAAGMLALSFVIR
jgi:hypothetical protein